MKIVIAGGSGFLGRRLASSLVAGGHDVTVLTRRAAAGPDASVRAVSWTPDGSAPSPGSGPSAAWTREIGAADVIVNLAGAGVADRRWSAPRKAVLRSSRIASTRSLVAALRVSETRPRVFLSASGIGYYGDGGEEILDESSPPGSDFLAMLCVEWEAEARAASGCRVVVMRTGVVLARGEGALKKLVPPFLLFGGGPIASGRQWMSWIHVDDWVAMMRWAIDTPAVTGPMNGTAPNPARNADFSRALGRALHRPSWLPMPAFALRLIVGEMAGIALVAGQRVMPAKAVSSGFAFQYPNLDEALQAALRRPT
jgi:uncharacterized protein (TIGR01777 family)